VSEAVVDEFRVNVGIPGLLGKLGFYLAAVNRVMRTPLEGPSLSVARSRVTDVDSR
jgi:hypothetical protein